MDIPKLWNNGERGDVVKSIIEYNFALLNKRMDERHFSKSFLLSDWVDGTIFISALEHNIVSPTPHVLMLSDGNYIDVYGGYYIDDENNIYLQSDIPFDGKVVIK